MLVAIIGISILAAVIAAVVTASLPACSQQSLTMKNKKSLKMDADLPLTDLHPFSIYIILHRRDNYPLY